MPRRSTLVLAVACLLLFLGLHLWQSPHGFQEPLSEVEIATYLSRIDRQLSLDDASKAALLKRLRIWAENDDGRPVHMLNLMRYHEELRRFAGGPDVNGTPRQVNADYEAAVRPLILKQGGYPVLSGPALGANLLETPASLDHWDRVSVVRYPNRRGFLEMISDPDYAGLEVLKMMSLEVVLVPFETQLNVPDLQWPVGSLLLALFLGTGWWRATRRQGLRPDHQPVANWNYRND